MWLARPVYEFLPYLYMLVGVALLAAAWFIEISTLPSVFLVVGVLSIMAGWCCGCGAGTTARARPNTTAAPWKTEKSRAEPDLP